MNDFASRRREAVEGAMMTEREMGEYKSHLNFSDRELASWNTIVDLGSGTQQEFAREMKRHFPQKKVFSIDARMTLSEEEDLAGMLPEEAQRRKEGRNNPAEGTIAAFADALPFEEGSIDAMLASHSIPMYLHTQEDIDRTFNEIFRVLREGGEARFFPIQRDKNLYEVFQWLDVMEAKGLIQYDLLLKEVVADVDEKYFLRLKKKGGNPISVAA